MSQKYISSVDFAAETKISEEKAAKLFAGVGRSAYKRKDGSYATRKTTAVSIAHKAEIKLRPATEKAWSGEVKAHTEETLKKIAAQKKASGKKADKRAKVSQKKVVAKQKKARAQKAPKASKTESAPESATPNETAAV